MAIGKIIAGGAALFAVGEYGAATYFFRRTMIRNHAKVDRTRKMAGTEWDQYIPKIHEAKEWLMEQKHEEVWVKSRDGLRLFGTHFPCEGSKKAVICFHGYTSMGLNDYSTLAKFYLEQGFHLLIVDERAHGKSEGTYIGFGCLDRYDAKVWIDYLIRRLGENCEILLHGDSMGASTVLMTTGLKLPKQVKAAVSDCAFTSAWEVFQSVLKHMYHLPPFPLLSIADRMVKRKAGYGLDECNARNEVKKATIPILFIHGENDTFVPCNMVYELYQACASEKKLLVIKGAGHVESCYKETEQYEEAIKSFIIPRFQGGKLDDEDTKRK